MRVTSRAGSIQPAGIRTATLPPVRKSLELIMSAIMSPEVCVYTVYIPSCGKLSYSKEDLRHSSQGRSWSRNIMQCPTRILAGLPMSTAVNR